MMNFYSFECLKGNKSTISWIIFGGMRLEMSTRKEQVLSKSLSFSSLSFPIFSLTRPLLILTLGSILTASHLSKHPGVLPSYLSSKLHQPLLSETQCCLTIKYLTSSVKMPSLWNIVNPYMDAKVKTASLWRTLLKNVPFQSTYFILLGFRATHNSVQ